MNRLAFRVLLAALAVLFALGSYLYAKHHAAAGSVEVSNAWARPTPPGAEVGVAYLTLHNSTAAPVKVLAIASDAAREVQMHDMSMTGGMMQMRQITEGLALEPGATVELAPGGMHLMLLGLMRPLVAGESLNLILQFSDGTERLVSVPVVEPN